MMRATSLTILIGCVVAALVPTTLFAGTAYVPNEGSGTISVIDTDTDRVTGTIRHGTKPRGIAIAADGARLYVSDQRENCLIVVDLSTGREVARVRLGESPEAIYLSPDGKWLSAAVEADDTVLLIDT